MNPGEVIKPAVTKDLAVELASKLYGFKVESIREMVSFDDKNFHIQVSKTHRNPHVMEIFPGGYTLKVTNTAKSSLPGHFDSMHSAMKHLHKNGLSVPLPVQNLEGETWTLQEVPLLQKSPQDNDQPSSGKCGVHLLTYLPGQPIGDKEYTTRILHDWGDLLARFHIAVQDFTNEVMFQKKIFWNIEHIPEIKPFMACLPEDKATLVLSVLDQYEEKVAKILPTLPSGFIHGDFNENNVLIRKIEGVGDPSWKVEGILDLEDMHWGTYAWDVGMMLAYVSLECKDIDPVVGMGHCLAGYIRRRSLTDEELAFLKMCLVCRLCQSLVLGAYSYSLEPTNSYLLVSAKFGWQRLQLIWEMNENCVIDTWKSIIASYSMNS